MDGSTSAMPAHSPDPQPPPVSAPDATSKLSNVHATPPAIVRRRPSSQFVSPLPLSAQRNVASPEPKPSKTAVNVAIRVRPPLQSTDPGFSLIPARFRGSACNVIDSARLAVQSTQGRKSFTFDHVFGPDAEQDAVWDYLSDSIDSFVQGYNVSILAYGQSGSGKSFTMGTSDYGEVVDGHAKGVIPRAAEALFQKLDNLDGVVESGIQSPNRNSSFSPLAQSPGPDAKKAVWQLKASYVEIYNEQLRDLLIAETVPSADRPQVHIREDTKGKILLSGLTQRNITSPNDLFAALEFGSKIRQTDSTAINAKSSRSHAIFTLSLVSKSKRPPRPAVSLLQEKRFSMPLPRSGSGNSLDALDLSSKIHFVDLAGSERLKNTGALGERAKEGISINAGLASLGKVIAQLSARNPGGHISYRDSRLTRLLQDSLGGSAVTYMLACVTPAEFYLTETLNTLHYAQRARAIQSKPEIQRIESGDQDVRVTRLQAEIAFLREQIKKDVLLRSPQERDRSVRKVTELQEQLLDMQQKYKALNSRHSLLIEELGQVRSESHADTPMLDQVVGEHAVDRLQRSTSFAEAVEQVVSEYEKTIDNLETALSNTRASLSKSEANLTERDLKITAMQSTIHKMQGRLQILTDRDVDNEAYLQRLESEVENANTGESKSAVLVDGLRSELARSKDARNNSEAYITSLEERLSDAEQDHAIMQRELDRLEHVVERQRSVNKLDGLMSNLEALRQAKASHPLKVAGRRPSDADQTSDVLSPPSPAASDQDASSTSITTYSRCTSPDSPLKLLSESKSLEPETGEAVTQSAFLTNKVESLSQELFDLRGEHEAALTEHEELQRKYSIALQELAAASDAKDHQNPSTADPFLGNNSPEEDSPSSQRPSPSRSPSLHSTSGRLLSSPSPSLLREGLHVQTTTDYVPASPGSLANTPTVALDGEGKNLAQPLQRALAQIESLKKELFRARVAAAPSPSARKSPMLRRKPSQDVPIVVNNGNADRTNRSFATLRNMSLDHFQGNPDLRQNFDAQLDQIMSDLHERSEKLQESSVELTSLRKDLESKTTMVAGLTRERSSMMNSTSVDFTALGKMQDQLQRNENRYQELRTVSAATESRLQERIRLLETQLANDFDNDTPLDVTGGGAFAQLGDASKPSGPSESTTVMPAEPEAKRAGSHATERDRRDGAVDASANRGSEAERLLAKVKELEQSLATVTDKQHKSDRLVQELEEQLSSTFDQQEATTKRASAVGAERQMQLEDALKAKQELERDMEEMRQRLASLVGEAGAQDETVMHRRQVSNASTSLGVEGLGIIEPMSPHRRMGRSVSASSLVQRPSSPATSSLAGSSMALPSPPPAMPLPPIPMSPSGASPLLSPIGDRHRVGSPGLVVGGSPRPDSAHMSEVGMAQAVEERERRIRTVEKHLFAEKQLTATLEEALVDLETAQTKTRGELEQWRKRCNTLEDEMIGLRKETSNGRSSLQAVEEEREMRLKAERARHAVEERMREFHATLNKKKKSKLNCFA